MVGCFDGVDALVESFFDRGEGAVGEAALPAGVAAAALGFPGDALRLLVMEPRVEEAPVAPFNRCRVAAITIRSYVPALRIHFTFLFRFALNVAGYNPPSCGAGGVRITLVVSLRYVLCGGPNMSIQRGLAVKNVQTKELTTAISGP
jgi:hypothetical protein